MCFIVSRRALRDVFSSHQGPALSLFGSHTATQHQEADPRPAQSTQFTESTNLLSSDA